MNILKQYDTYSIVDDINLQIIDKEKFEELEAALNTQKYDNEVLSFDCDVMQCYTVLFNNKLFGCVIPIEYQLTNDSFQDNKIIATGEKKLVLNYFKSKEAENEKWYTKENRKIFENEQRFYRYISGYEFFIDKNNLSDDYNNYLAILNSIKILHPQDRVYRDIARINGSMRIIPRFRDLIIGPTFTRKIIIKTGRKNNNLQQDPYIEKELGVITENEKIIMTGKLKLGFLGEANHKHVRFDKCDKPEIVLFNWIDNIKKNEEKFNNLIIESTFPMYSFYEYTFGDEEADLDFFKRCIKPYLNKNMSMNEYQTYMENYDRTNINKSDNDYEDLKKIIDFNKLFSEIHPLIEISNEQLVVEISDGDLFNDNIVIIIDNNIDLIDCMY